MHERIEKERFGLYQRRVSGDGEGVVAVSDHQQLEKIRSNALDVKELKDKLKYWDYEDILKVHESLEFDNSCINNLGLVPQGF